MTEKHTTTTTHMTTQRDWVEAALRTIAQGGPEALRVEILARELGTTKGVFYDHFKDRVALHTAIWAYWREMGVEAVAAYLETLPEGAPRLRGLVAAASDAPPNVGGKAAEVALRAWAFHVPRYARIVDGVDQARVDFLVREFTHAGTRDPRLAARLLYGALLGNYGPSVEADLSALLALLLRDRP